MEKNSPSRGVRRPPLERMVHIHDELHRGAPVNCSSLGQTLEVSRKTLVRDITYMRDRLELPIEFDPVHNTYRYTEPVESFPALQVSEGEVFALLVARKALEQYRGTSFFRQLSTSFDKLAGALKDTVSFAPTAELHSVSFKNIGVGKSDTGIFNEINRAVVRELEVLFDYRKPGDSAPTRRRVQPYHLSYRENLWYLVGLDLDRGALRTFAVPRISAVTITGTKFTRPAEFSAEKFFANAFGVVGGAGEFRVVIRFSAAAADRIREREWHESQKIRELPDGGVELTLKLGALEEVERWLREWGADAEALQPKELRDRMRATVAALKRKYD